MEERPSANFVKNSKVWASPSGYTTLQREGFGMTRKSISCALAGLLTVVPALAFFLMLLGYWTPGSEVVVLVLIFCFAVGVVWLGSEVSEILWGGR
jgi:accessory gene regulator protein AgrB